MEVPPKIFWKLENEKLMVANWVIFTQPDENRLDCDYRNLMMMKRAKSVREDYYSPRFRHYSSRAMSQEHMVQGR